MSELSVYQMRKNLNMTQDEFGKLLGVDRRTIISYEQSGYVPPAKLQLIEFMQKNGIGTVPLEKKGKAEKKAETIQKSEPEKIELEKIDTNEVLLTEIEAFKDHIKTLKAFLVEKTKVAELYEAENNMLKEKIKLLTNKPDGE